MAGALIVKKTRFISAYFMFPAAHLTLRILNV